MNESSAATVIGILGSNLLQAEDALLKTLLRQLIERLTESRVDADSLLLPQGADASLQRVVRSVTPHAPVFMHHFFVPLITKLRSASPPPRDAARIRELALDVLRAFTEDKIRGDPKGPHTAACTTLADLWGALAAATHSFAVLCEGALSLLRIHLRRALRESQSSFGAETEFALTERAESLMDAWHQYFGSYNAHYYAELVGPSPAAAGIPSGMQESQWLFVVCAVQNLRRTAPLSVAPFLNALTDALMSSCRASILLAMKNAYAVRSAAWGSNLVCRSSLFWNLLFLQRSTTDETQAALSAAWSGDNGDFFRSLLVLCERVTKVQAPQEEAYMAVVAGGGAPSTDSTARFWESVNAHYTRWSSPMSPSPGHKRPRSGCEGSTAAGRLERYLADTFFTSYHSTCFVILSSKMQTQLSDVLRELAAAIIGAKNQAQMPNAKTEAAIGKLDEADEENEVWSTPSSSSSLSPVAVVEDSKPDVRGTVDSVVRLLRRDCRFPMVVLHSVFTLLRRRRSVAGEAAAVLDKYALPLLVALFSGGAEAGGGEEERDGEGRRLRLHPQPSPEDDAIVSRWGAKLLVARCVLSVVCADLLCLSWKKPEVYLSLCRYHQIQTVLDGSGQTLEAGVAVLEEWLAEKGDMRMPREPGTELAARSDEWDHSTRSTKAYAAMQPGTSDAAGEEDEGDEAAFRSVIPFHFPAPCSLLLVVSLYETLSKRFCELRLNWERALDRDESDGVGSSASALREFCASTDVSMFGVVMTLANRMVFAFQPQEPELFRRWFGYLFHVFSVFVPPSEEEMVRRRPAGPASATDCFGDAINGAQSGWRTLHLAAQQSSQTELRGLLGEKLAQLVILPFADTHVVEECPSAQPRHTSRESLSRAVELSRRTTPLAVLETLALFLGIPPGREGQELPLPADVAATLGKSMRHSFLGAWGLVSFLRTLEEGMVSAESSGPRFRYLLRTLWSVADNLVS